MQQSLTRNSNRTVEDELQRRLADQLAQIQAASTVACYGIREIHYVHRETSALYKKTLEKAFQAIQTAGRAGRLTRIQLAALYHLSEAYRYELLMIAEETGDSLIGELERW